MAEDEMLKDAIEAIRQGKYERARDILTRLLKNDPHNPTYWLWMSAAVPTRKEKAFCLQNVLRDDPNNAFAQQGLAMIGVKPIEKIGKPPPIVRRKWKTEYGLPKSPPKDRRRQKAVQRLAVTGIVGVLLIAVFVALVLMSPKKALPVYIKPTKTPGPPPTFTPTPTYIGYVAAPSTTENEGSGEPAPLWMLLDATYTPTPVYVNTPHPISEAYRAGQVAFQQGKWQTAVDFFQQAQKLEPQAADIAYYLGEAYFKLGEERLALAAYQQAIQIDAKFAPPYVGRARSNLALNPKSPVMEDLDTAIRLDANLAEAYLERAQVFAAQGDTALAEKDLQTLERLWPSSPLPYRLRAKIFLQKGDLSQALAAAQQAHELDKTDLESYLVYAEAALVNDETALAQDLLGTYLNFQKKDTKALELYGRALMGLGSKKAVYEALTQGVKETEDLPAAQEALERAAALDRTNTWLGLYRGCVFLEQGEGQKAVNAFITARGAVYQPEQSEDELSLWFAYQIGMSRGLLQAGRFDSAVDQLNFAETLAVTPSQKAIVYYWRGRTYEAMNKPSFVRRDWQALVQLTEADVPEEWLEQARKWLAELTPTAPMDTATPTKPATTATPKPSLSTVTPAAVITATPTP